MHDVFPRQSISLCHANVRCLRSMGLWSLPTLGKWFQCEWKGAWSDVHITAKELLPIVIACVLWGSGWVGKTVLFQCDNAAMVAIIRLGSSRHPLCMHLMRSLSLFAAVFKVTLTAEHLPGRENEAADALSRGNLGLFFRQVPRGEKVPTAIPNSFLEMNQPDWTSTAWRRQFADILRQVSQPQPSRRTKAGNEGT